MSKSFSMEREPRKRGLKAWEKLSENKTISLCVIGREDGMFTEFVPRRRPSCNVLQSILETRIAAGTTLCTYNNPAFISLAKKLKFKLYCFNNDKEIKKDIYHIKNIRSFVREVLSGTEHFHSSSIIIPVDYLCTSIMYS